MGWEGSWGGEWAGAWGGYVPDGVPAPAARPLPARLEVDAGAGEAPFIVEEV